MVGAVKTMVWARLSGDLINLPLITLLAQRGLDMTVTDSNQNFPISAYGFRTCTRLYR